MATERDREFAEFFAARMLALRRLAYGLCGDWHTAEDLVQVTFVRLYHHWERVRHETADAYARRILVNRFLSERRRGGRESVRADVPDQPTAAGRDPGEVIDVGRALAGLPPRQRALVVLRYIEDVSVAEAARLLNISEGTVKSQTARGIEKLRTALGDRIAEGQRHG